MTPTKTSLGYPYYIDGSVSAKQIGDKWAVEGCINGAKRFDYVIAGAMKDMLFAPAVTRLWDSEEDALKAIEAERAYIFSA